MPQRPAGAIQQFSWNVVSRAWCPCSTVLIKVKIKKKNPTQLSTLSDHTHECFATKKHLTIILRRMIVECFLLQKHLRERKLLRERLNWTEHWTFSYLLFGIWRCKGVLAMRYAFGGASWTAMCFFKISGVLRNELRTRKFTCDTYLSSPYFPRRWPIELWGTTVMDQPD